MLTAARVTLNHISFLLYYTNLQHADNNVEDGRVKHWEMDRGGTSKEDMTLWYYKHMNSFTHISGTKQVQSRPLANLGST